MTMKTELKAAVLTAIPCSCKGCRDKSQPILGVIEQLPDTPNPLARIELYAPIPAGRTVIGVRPPRKGDTFVDTSGNVATAGRDWDSGCPRFILAPLPPPKTWSCPGLANGKWIYSRASNGERSIESPTGFTLYLPSSLFATFAWPEHLGVYDVVNEVGTLRTGGRVDG